MHRINLYRQFIFLVVSQFISLIGSGLTGFCVTIIIYNKSHLVTAFSILYLCDKIPAILSSFFAGTFVDIHSKKKNIMIMDGIAALSSLFIFIMYSRGLLELWHVYLSTSVNSIIRPFHSFSINSCIPTMVPKERLSRANGLMQLIMATSDTITPILAGSMIAIISVGGLVAIDVGTFIFAIAVMVFLTIPEIKHAGNVALEEEQKESFLSKTRNGWKFVYQKKPLLHLLIYVSMINFIVGFLHVLLAPMILNFGDAKTLGTVMSFGAFGMLLGSVATSAFGVPKNYVRNLLVFGLLESVFVFMIGFRPDPALVSMSLACLFVCFPFFGNSIQCVLQTKTPTHLLGRVIAIKQCFVWIGLCISYGLAGPLMDRFYGPLYFGVHSSLTFFTGIWGLDKGREMGSFFGIMAIMMLGIVLYFFMDRTFTNLDRVIKDQI